MWASQVLLELGLVQEAAELARPGVGDRRPGRLLAGVVVVVLDEVAPVVEVEGAAAVDRHGEALRLLAGRR